MELTGIGALIILAEIIMSGFWVPIYFQKGLPLYKKTRSYYNEESTLDIDVDALSIIFKRRWVQSIIFRLLSSNEIAFREKIFEIAFMYYVPIMHGLIRIDRNRMSVSLIGYVNWSIPIGIAFFINPYYSDSPFTRNSPMFIYFLLIVLLFSYFAQLRIFNKIFERVMKDYFSGSRLRSDTPQVV
jgi:hypothetical protein